VGHERGERRGLLGIERLACFALIAPSRTARSPRAFSSAAMRACAPARVRPPRWAMTAGDRPLSRRWRKVAGRRPNSVLAWSAMAGVWKTWKITWLERWPCVSVSSARRSSTARVARRTAFRRGATSAWASLRCEVQPRLRASWPSVRWSSSHASTCARSVCSSAYRRASS
jgi:hypothetical protein